MCDKGARISKLYAELQGIPARSVRIVKIPRSFTFEHANNWMKYHNFHEPEEYELKPTHPPAGWQQYKKSVLYWIFYVNYHIFNADIEEINHADGVKVAWQMYAPTKNKSHDSTVRIA